MKVAKKIIKEKEEKQVDDFNPDFNIDMSFGQDLSFGFEDENKNKSNDEFVVLPKIKPLTCKLNAKSAFDLIDNLKKDFNINNNYYFIVSGRFIYFDFVNLFLRKFNVQAETLTISTLSFSLINILSLKSLIQDNYVKKVNIIISYYFYSHEKNKILQALINEIADICELTLSVDRTHCKLILIETSKGTKLTMHGSANLRSSENYEQFMINTEPELYDFNFEFLNKIMQNNNIEIIK